MFLLLLTPFLKALDMALDDPTLRALVRSVAHKIWDSVTEDPDFNSKLEVLNKSLGDPNVTQKERKNVLQQINELHPKV
jgi:hypothetical protein